MTRIHKFFPYQKSPKVRLQRFTILQMPEYRRFSLKIPVDTRAFEMKNFAYLELPVKKFLIIGNIRKKSVKLREFSEGEIPQFQILL